MPQATSGVCVGGCVTMGQPNCGSYGCPANGGAGNCPCVSQQAAPVYCPTCPQVTPAPVFTPTRRAAQPVALGGWDCSNGVCRPVALAPQPLPFLAPAPPVAEAVFIQETR